MSYVTRVAICLLMAFSTTTLLAQLPFQEGFETDGDGSRYTVTDPGAVADTGEAGPAMWGLAAFTTELTAPISIEGGGFPIGLAQSAPEKRAAILWDVSLTQDDVDIEAWSVWLGRNVIGSYAELSRN